MRNAYRPHDALVEPARPSSAVIRLILGSVLIVVLVLSLLFSLSALLSVFLPARLWDELAVMLESGATPAGVITNLYIFGLVIIALAIAARAVHGRSLPSLIGNWSLARYHFARVCLYLFGLQVALGLLMPTPTDMTPEPNLSFSYWLTLMPLALPALLIQTGAEELVFRGYLQSQLAARFADPRIWIFVPSAVFGLLHYDPVVNGDATWLVVAWAALFGLAAADLTARTGTLGAAVALHFMNNFYAIFLVAPANNFDGLALYTFPFALDDMDALWLWAPLDLMLIFVSWLAARLALRV